jgi:hypothetical protein
MPERAISSLERLFEGGQVPDPPLVGFHSGRAITSTLSNIVDSVGRRLAEAYMPWLGKTIKPRGMKV